MIANPIARHVVASSERCFISFSVAVCKEWIGYNLLFHTFVT